MIQPGHGGWYVDARAIVAKFTAAWPGHYRSGVGFAPARRCSHPVAAPSADRGCERQPSGAPRLAIRRCAVCVVAELLGTIAVRAGEVCRFAGTTDYSGRIEVSTDVNARAIDGTTTVDVIVQFMATPWPLVHIRYLMQEVSVWKSDQLQSVATNSRYLVGGHIVRQIWDLFDRRPDGLEAYRLEGKTLDDFRRKYPAFVRHWGAANFGQPWIQDYRLAGAERRTDLDLPASSVGPDLRSPLALAFYWSRWISRSGQAATVFLPGFKKDKRLDLTIGAVEPSGAGQQVWQTSIRYPALGSAHASTAKAWVSTDRHLLQLTGSVQSGSYAGDGVIRLKGCDGTAESPNAAGR